MKLENSSAEWALSDPALLSGSPALPRKPRRDDVFELEIAEVDAAGQGVARVGEYRLHVRGALPGERVWMQLQRRRKQVIEGRVVRRVAQSSDRIAPRCAHTADCGGCCFQELSYPRQLLEKRRLAERILEPLAAFGAFELPALHGAEQSFGYRNKMDFTFGDQRWLELKDDGRHPQFGLGLHAPRRFDKVLDVGRCEIAFEACHAILSSARRLALELGIEPWSVLKKSGTLRHLVLREARHSGEILAQLVVFPGRGEALQAFIAGLLAAHPELTCLVETHNSGEAVVAYGERDILHKGTGYIRESLGGLELQLSAGSFFQTNTAQAERLVELVEGFVRRAPRRGLLLDLYCGTGTFALCLAKHFEAVLGLELLEPAVRDAQRNAARNGIHNARFLVADAKRLAQAEQRAAWGLGNPDLLLVDPPRAGLHPEVGQAILELLPARLIYISCNLQSAVRDLGPLLAGPYRLAELELVDLFPHTPHLEGLFLLERRP